MRNPVTPLPESDRCSFYMLGTVDATARRKRWPALCPKRLNAGIVATPNPMWSRPDPYRLLRLMFA